MCLVSISCSPIANLNRASDRRRTEEEEVELQYWKRLPRMIMDYWMDEEEEMNSATAALRLEIEWP